MSEKRKVVLDKSCVFALEAVALYKALSTPKEYVLSGQFVRATAIIGANMEEATAAYSHKRFTAEMSIACESHYWLRLPEAGHFIKVPTNLIEQAYG
jgi:four helix bundle protein